MRNCTNLAIFFTLLLSLSFGTARAQTLPSLKNAAEVTTGVLPNGMTYYLVTNKTDKGKADFAIIQRGGDDAQSARCALVDLPHFDGKRPYSFLSSSGVGYGRRGFVESEVHSTRYRFERVPVSSQEASDTTLMMMFGISERSPYSQALVVSGDINPSALVERMKVLSMMVSRRRSLPKDDGPKAPDTEGLSVTRVEPLQAGVSALTLEFFSPRAPRELMNTVQPLVSEMFAKQLGSIGRNRVENTFRHRNIPLAAVDFNYRSSADSPFPELFSLTLHTSTARLQDAVQALSEVFSTLAAGQTGIKEYLCAREEFLSSVSGSSAGKTTNREWVDRCISAYLYGSSLASTASRTEFFEQQKLPVEKMLQLFNAFAAALLNPSKSVDLRYSAPALAADEDELRAVFQTAWRAAAVEASVQSSLQDSADSTQLLLPKVKVKLKKEVPEPITGGKMWLFSNGMRVIYKKTDSGNNASARGRFDYALMIKGGYSGVPGISHGECGFVQDMLALYDVSGVSGTAFRNMLQENSVSQSVSVSLSDMRIQGTAPSDRLLLVLKSLLALSGERKVNQDAFAYYSKCEALSMSLARSGGEGVEAVLDSIMRPSYIYSPFKRAGALKNDLPKRAASYYDKQFSRVSDGVLVLIGDLNEEQAKKYLIRCLGGFQAGSQHAARPNAGYSLRSGWSSCTVGIEDASVGYGDASASSSLRANDSVCRESFGASVNVAVSALVPYSGERLFSFRIARSLLERELVKSLSDAGMYVEISDSYELFPVERLDVRICCRPVAEDGLPYGITPEFALKALGRVRDAVENASSGDFTDADLKFAKAGLADSVGADYALPSVMMSNALMRYSEGKDLVSSYKDKINAVKLDDVRDILRLLADGCKVEYVVY